METALITLKASNFQEDMMRRLKSVKKDDITNYSNTIKEEIFKNQEENKNFKISDQHQDKEGKLDYKIEEFNKQEKGIQSEDIINQELQMEFEVQKKVKLEDQAKIENRIELSETEFKETSKEKDEPEQDREDKKSEHNAKLKEVKYYVIEESKETDLFECSAAVQENSDKDSNVKVCGDRKPRKGLFTKLKRFKIMCKSRLQKSMFQGSPTS